MTATHEDIDVDFTVALDGYEWSPQTTLNLGFRVTGFVRFDRSGDDTTPNGPPEPYVGVEMIRNQIYVRECPLPKEIRNGLSDEFFDDLEELAWTVLRIEELAVEHALQV